MSTFLFDKIIFGPVRSRRLGVSLGINLLPNDSKYCTYDCVYCECGWTYKNHKAKLHPRKEVYNALDNMLQKMLADGNPPDNITFAGNGEPTVHPDFEGIIEDTILLRDKYFPKAMISVLSNATQVHKASVMRALNKVDQNILKLDTANDDLFQVINRPTGKIDTRTIVERLKIFNGNLTIQTMFIRGSYQGQEFDNTTFEEVEKWIELLREIKPKNVMIYPIERGTPTSDLLKIPLKELEAIAERVRAIGLEVLVYG
ncbi:MAG: radical SAM protein [Bacteroidetes bacterium]|nr:MAG: radical SAM protein [Bacteroidota bacterium]